MSDTIKLVIAIPTASRIHCKCHVSLMALQGSLMKGLSLRPDSDLEFSQDLQQSSCIQSNREMLVRRAIDSDKTHLLFIDDDMGFHPDVVNIMLGRRQPVVATNYLIKHLPPADPEFVAVGLNGRRIITRESSVGLQEIAYSGFGVSLFELDVFRKTPQPWFLPVFVPEASAYTTEDNPCFERIRNAGFKCYLDHDASKLVTHHGESVWSWDMWRPPVQKPEAAEEKVHPAPRLELQEAIRNGHH